MKRRDGEQEDGGPGGGRQMVAGQHAQKKPEQQRVQEVQAELNPVERDRMVADEAEDKGDGVSAERALGRRPGQIGARRERQATAVTGRDVIVFIVDEPVVPGHLGPPDDEPQEQQEDEGE